MEKQLVEIVKKLENNVIYVSELAEDLKTYQKAVNFYYDLIKKGFEEEAYRKAKVNIKFFKEEGAFIHQMEFRHFITNLMFWEPLVALDRYQDINESHIVDCSKISSDLIKDYIDEKFILPYRTMFGHRKLNKTIHDMIYNLSRISTDFNIILGLTMNVETFMDVAKRNPRFNEIIRTTLDENMQPNEIESTLDALMHEQVSILKEEDNLLKPILLSKTGIKEKQLSEFALNGGLKPDLDGKTMPIPINSNFIVGGLKNSIHYYVDSIGGRKATIMNATVMGSSGHFSRMVMMLSTTVMMDGSLEDCRTVHPIRMHIKSKQHLKRLKGRNYRRLTSRVYSELKASDTHLIGEEILLRSPITCAGKHGICKKCYGALYYTNKDVYSIGGYSGSKITEPLGQAVLSTKHLLTTRSEKVEFTEGFDLFFEVGANEILFNPSPEVDISQYTLRIIKENIHEIVEFDDSEFNSFIKTFAIYDKVSDSNINIEEANMSDMFIAPELKDLIKKYTKSAKNSDYYEIPLDEFSGDERIFVVQIENNELTRPLYDMMHLLNREGNHGCDTVDKMAQGMLDLLIESKINSDSIHGEILVKPLIRDAHDILKYPDFKTYDSIKNYQILTVSKALENHPAVLVSLSFQNLERQLSNPATFRKTSSSFIDAFYRNKP